MFRVQALRIKSAETYDTAELSVHFHPKLLYLVIPSQTSSFVTKHLYQNYFDILRCFHLHFAI